MGLHFDKVYKSSLLLNGTFRNVVFQNSIAALDLIIGDKLRYNVHYYVGAGRGPGVGFNSRLNTVDLPIDLPVRIDIGDSIAVQRLLFNMTDLTQEVYTNLVNNNKFAIGLAAEIKYFKTFTDQAVDFVTDKNFVDEQGWFLSGRVFMHHDTRDRIFFTRSGVLTQLNLRGTKPLRSLKYEDGKLDPGWNIDLQLFWAQPLSEKLTTHISIDAGMTQGIPAPPFRYLLGSNNRNLINNFRAFPGLSFARISGDNLLKTSVGFQYQILKSHFIHVGGDLAFLADKDETLFIERHRFVGLNLSYGINTPLGPVAVSYGLSNRESEVYFTLGYWF